MQLDKKVELNNNVFVKYYTKLSGFTAILLPCAIIHIGVVNKTKKFFLCAILLSKKC